MHKPHVNLLQHSLCCSHCWLEISLILSLSSMLYITDLSLFVHPYVTYMWFDKFKVREQRDMNCFCNIQNQHKNTGSLHLKYVIQKKCIKLSWPDFKYHSNTHPKNKKGEMEIPSFPTWIKWLHSKNTDFPDRNLKIMFLIWCVTVSFSTSDLWQNETALY